MKYSDKALDILQKNESTYLLCETLYNKMMALMVLGYRDEAIRMISQLEYLYSSHQKLDMLENLKSYSGENISS